MHQPMLPAAHQPGPKPPRPSRNPNPEAERPQNPKPPPDQPRNSAAARLATYVRRHRHPQQRRMQSPEKQHPRVTNTPSRPRPQPQRRTPQSDLLLTLPLENKSIPNCSLTSDSPSCLFRTVFAYKQSWSVHISVLFQTRWHFHWRKQHCRYHLNIALLQPIRFEDQKELLHIYIYIYIHTHR